MYRKSIEFLKDWYEKENHAPLVISGQKKVGKTYLVKKLFGEEVLNGNYVYIDCRTNLIFLKYENEFTFPNSIKNVCPSFKENDLIIFDNIEESNNIYNILKLLYENYPTYHVIAIQTFNNYDFNEFEKLTIYPLSFDEFMINVDKDLYNIMYDENLRKKYKQEVYKYFNDYLLIGGLPSVINIYKELINYESIPNESINNENIIEEDNIEVENNEVENKEIESQEYNKKSFYDLKLELKNIEKENTRTLKNYFQLFLSQSKVREIFCGLYRTLFYEFFISNKISPTYHSSALVKEVDKLVKMGVLIKSTKFGNDLFQLYLYDNGLLNLGNDDFFFSSSLEEARKSLTQKNLDNYVACEIRKYGYDVYYYKARRKSRINFMIKKNNYVLFKFDNIKNYLFLLKDFKSKYVLEKAYKVNYKISSVSQDNYQENNIEVIDAYKLWKILK